MTLDSDKANVHTKLLVFVNDTFHLYTTLNSDGMFTLLTQTIIRMHLHQQIITPRAFLCVYYCTKPVCIHSHHPLLLSFATELRLHPPPHHSHCTGCPATIPRVCLHSNLRLMIIPSPAAVKSLRRDLRPTLQNSLTENYCRHPCLYR